jgi:mannose-6-phosphate isomerase-like protein (cupin superfamily)
MSIADIGPGPQAFNLETETLENPNYRTVAWSGKYLQVTLMSIPVDGDIGLEQHPATDQFIRLDRGRGRAQMGPSKDELTFDQEVTDGWCVIVPAGSWHNVTNIGDEPMQVYTVYAPQHHEPGKVQTTKAIADTDTADEPADWSVQPDPVADQHA